MDITEVQKKLPFLSIIRYQETELIGVIQNCDDSIISFYDFNTIRSKPEKDKFMEFCDTWYYESNRMLPINIYIGRDMTQYRYCLKTYQKKEVEVICGPCTSLSNILKKRIKRRQIKLVRSPV